MAIPYGITFHPKWWSKNAGIDFSQPFFDDAAYRIDCDVKMRRCLYEHFGEYGIGEKDPQPRPLLGTDLLAAGYLYSQILGCQVVYSPDDSPQVLSMNLSAKQAAELKAPSLDDNPFWQAQQKQIDWLLEKYGRVETYINLQGIQNIAIDVMNQTLFTAYYTDKAAVHTLLGEIYKLSRDIGRRFKALSSDISGGVTAIIRQVLPECYLTSNCTVELVSNKIYEEFLLEYDQKLADDFGCFGVHHCGKSMQHVTEGYSKIQGLAFAEVGAGSKLEHVRRSLPGIPLNARYSPVKIINETPDEIAENVKALYAAGTVQDTGLLSISCVGMGDNVPEENIRAFLAACKAL